jgi:hypothetical protein
LNEKAELLELGKRLYGFRETAVIVPYVEKSSVDWIPVEQECHANVDNWALRNPTSKAVRGWMYFNLLGMFTAHSIVEDENGVLLDITPSRAAQRYPFIRHPGSESEFVELVEKYQVRNFYYAI